MKSALLVPIFLSSLSATRASYINYTTVTGYFLQDDPSVNSSTFDYTTTNLGLINRTYPEWTSETTQWGRFLHHITTLNRVPNVDYKLLILARHAEGYHNAAESFYGTPAWNCYWSLLNGNSTATWADARLTEVGIASAETAKDFFSNAIKTAGFPVPDNFYTSPLQRCLQTANITWSTIIKDFNPQIKEFLREGISLHTCDRRHNRTFIASEFPWTFERGFAENDPYWTGVTGETNAAQDVRSKTVLDEVFHAGGQVLSITSHSGEIASLLRVLGHRVFSLRTGAVLPVLVRAETLAQDRTTATPTFTPSPHCTAPPATSLSDAGCVCASSALPITTPLISVGPFKRDL